MEMDTPSDSSFQIMSARGQGGHEENVLTLLASNESSTLAWWCYLSDEKRCMSRADADGEAVDNQSVQLLDGC